MNDGPRRVSLVTVASASASGTGDEGPSPHNLPSKKSKTAMANGDKSAANKSGSERRSTTSGEDSQPMTIRIELKLPKSDADHFPEFSFTDLHRERSEDMDGKDSN